LDIQTTQERQHYSSPGDGHHPLIWPETLNRSRQSSLRVPACKTIKRLPLPEGIPKERAEFVDDFDHCVIKRTIHGLFSRKIAPTVSIIHKEIKDSIKISKSGHQTHHSEATYNLCSDFG
jgi:hypothetical protein